MAVERLGKARAVAALARADGRGCARVVRSPMHASISRGGFTCACHPRRFNRDNQDAMARMDALPSLAGLLTGDNVAEVQSMAAMSPASLTKKC